MIGTVVDNKGKESSKYCKIFIRDVGFVVVNHSYKEVDEIQTLGHQPKVQVGFKQQ